MTLHEPHLLAGLASIPFLWLLARNAARPRSYAVGSLRLWREVQHAIGTSRRASQLDLWLLIAIGAVIATTVGAAGLGTASSSSTAPASDSPKAPPSLLSAKIESGWLHCRSNAEVGRWELRNANPVVSYTYGFAGSETASSVLRKLAAWEDTGHLVLLADGRESLYLYAEPFVSLRGELAPATREALASVLAGVRWDADAKDAILIASDPPAAGSKGIVFVKAANAADTRDLTHDSVAVASGWESILSYPELIDLARSHAPRANPNRRPLFWFNHAEERFAAMEVDDRSGVLHIHLGDPTTIERSPWYAVLIGLAIREVTGHDVIGRERYSLHRSPTLADLESADTSNPGLFPSGVINRIGAPDPQVNTPAPQDLIFTFSLLRHLCLVLAWCLLVGLALWMLRDIAKLRRHAPNRRPT